jgi:hypothetical protein
VETLNSEEVFAVSRKKEATEIEALTQKADTEAEDTEEAILVWNKKEDPEVAALN